MYEWSDALQANMVAQQKIKDSTADVADAQLKPGSPKSRLGMLKRSSNKQKKDGPTDDPFRFQGVGVQIKCKLIGERSVPEARGDAMCAEAMRAAKMAIKQAGSHKQRITLAINIEGLKIKDEKTGMLLYDFPVSKISFIARDTSDARAFGFVFGCQDGAYKFYGIKTAQTADNAVLSIRDMFQVVYLMKKKQIQEMKLKKEEEQKKKAEESAQNETNYRVEDGVPCADLLDLETELQVIEQGCNQLQNIPSMPEDSWPTGASDPFGSPFVNPAVAQVADPAANAFWGSPAFSGSAAQPFAATNPFIVPSAVPALAAQDPFDTHCAQRVISSINPQQPFGIAPPPPRHPPVLDVAHHHLPLGSATSSVNGSNGQASPEIQWGVSSSSASSFKENSEPQFSEAKNNAFADDFLKPTGDKVTTLEEAFSKLVDMDKLLPSKTPPAETKKNPFEHLINPPKLPLNAMGTPPAPFNSTTQAQLVNSTRDPFNDDFFN